MSETGCAPWPLVLGERDGKVYRLTDHWPDGITVTGRLLAQAAEGGCIGVGVSGFIARKGGNIILTEYESVTFTCENGRATYDLAPQSAEDFRRDVWRAGLREAT